MGLHYRQQCVVCHDCALCVRACAHAYAIQLLLTSCRCPAVHDSSRRRNIMSNSSVKPTRTRVVCHESRDLVLSCFLCSILGTGDLRSCFRWIISCRLDGLSSDQNVRNRDNSVNWWLIVVGLHFQISLYEMRVVLLNLYKIRNFDFVRKQTATTQVGYIGHVFFIINLHYTNLCHVLCRCEARLSKFKMRAQEI